MGDERKHSTRWQWQLERYRTPAAIEKVFQAVIRERGHGSPEIERARRECNARAHAIAKSRPRGHLLPVRLDKGRGCSQRWKLGAEVYRTGTWGNGAGFRYCVYYRNEWFESRLKAARLRRAKRKKALAWFGMGYDWRVLEALER